MYVLIGPGAFVQHPRSRDKLESQSNGRGGYKTIDDHFGDGGKLKATWLALKDKRLCESSGISLCFWGQDRVWCVNFGQIHCGTWYRSKSEVPMYDIARVLIEVTHTFVWGTSLLCNLL